MDHRKKEGKKRKKFQRLAQKVFQRACFNNVFGFGFCVRCFDLIWVPVMTAMVMMMMNDDE